MKNLTKGTCCTQRVIAIETKVSHEPYVKFDEREFLLPTIAGLQKSLNGSNKDPLCHYSHLEMSLCRQHPLVWCYALTYMQQKTFKPARSFFVQ